MTQTYKVQVSMNQAHIVESGFVWKQGDFGFNIEIEVLDFDTTGATPQIIFRKSTGAVEATQISVAGNKFTYAIRGTELDTPGPCVCDLKLNDSTTKRVSTASFKYFVIPDTMDGLEQEASSYSDTIEQLMDGTLKKSETAGLVRNDNTINETIEGTVANQGVQINNLKNALDAIREHTKNLFEPENVLKAYFTTGSIKANDSSRTVWIPCEASTTYTISKTAGTRFAVGYTTTQPAVGVTPSEVSTAYQSSSITITTGANAQYLVAWVYNGGSDSGTAEAMLASVQIELGSSATSYAPPYTAIDRMLRDLQSSMILDRGILENGTSLNDVKTPAGYYILKIDSQYYNLPDAETEIKRRTLFCYPYQSSVLQILYNSTDGIIYQRLYTSGSWSDWKGTKDNLFFNYGTLQNTTPKTDLNTLYGKSGFYTMGVSSEYEHDPVGPANRRLLVCYTNNGTYTHQIMLNATTGDSYQRVYASGSWSDWKGTRDNLFFDYGTLPNTTPKTDLNTLYGKDGFYTMGVSSEYEHDPVGPANRRLLVCYTNGTSFTHQILFNSNTGDIYQRVYASGSWSEWKTFTGQLPEVCGSYTDRICTSHAGVYSNSKYQNSPKAFKDARKLGILYQELDVVFTKDLVPIVSHSSFADNAMDNSTTPPTPITSEFRFKDYTLEQLKENYVFGDENYYWTIQTLEEAYSLMQDLGCRIIVDVGGGYNNPTGSRELLCDYMIKKGIACEALITSECTGDYEHDTFGILCATGGEHFPLGVVVAASTSDDLTTAVAKINAIISAKSTLNLEKAWCFVRRERMASDGDLLSYVDTLLDAGVKIGGYSYNASTYNMDIPTFFSLVISANVNINYLRYLDTINS